jgi:undecaprenyl-diphosphatase
MVGEAWNFLLSVDKAISVFMNGFVQRNWSCDQLLVLFSTNSFVKGVVVISAFWYLWFRYSEDQKPNLEKDSRAILLSTLLICAPMLVAIRILAVLLPFRVRPILVASLHLKTAFGFEVSNLEKWSSFPSDHTALFFGLTTGLFLVSRRVGITMYIYTILLVATPRLILGIHYTSDILVGIFLGVLTTQLVRVRPVRSLLTGLPLKLLEESPGMFYAGLFILTFLTADLYDPARSIVRVLLRAFGIVSN